MFKSETLTGPTSLGVHENYQHRQRISTSLTILVFRRARYTTTLCDGLERPLAL